MSSTVVKTLTKGRYVLHAPMRVSKIHPNAEIPFKENEDHAGWDVTVVARCDNRAEDVQQEINTFATGLVIRPPPHYHLEVIPHPSLAQAGYMLASSPMIINPGNEEELTLPLYKYKECEDLELPFRAALLVLRLTEYSVVASEAPTRRPAQRITHLEEEEIEFVRAPKKPTRGGKQGKASHMF